jgi:hypothetical protein
MLRLHVGIEPLSSARARVNIGRAARAKRVLTAFRVRLFLVVHSAVMDDALPFQRGEQIHRKLGRDDAIRLIVKD